MSYENIRNSIALQNGFQNWDDLTLACQVGNAAESITYYVDECLMMSEKLNFNEISTSLEKPTWKNQK